MRLQISHLIVFFIYLAGIALQIQNVVGKEDKE